MKDTKLEHSSFKRCLLVKLCDISYRWRLLLTLALYGELFLTKLSEKLDVSKSNSSRHFFDRYHYASLKLDELQENTIKKKKPVNSFWVLHI